MIEEAVHRSNNEINNRTASFAMPWNDNVLCRMIEDPTSQSRPSTQSCAPVVYAEPHTPCGSSFETHCGSSDVFENLLLNHAVDTCVVDIQRHLNEPGQLNWPTFGNWNGDADWCGETATGIVTNGWDTTIRLPTGLLHSGVTIEDWPQESQPACSRKGWAKALLQQNTWCANHVPTQMAEHNSYWTAWNTSFIGIVACILRWRSRTGHRSLNLHVQEKAGRRHFCRRTLDVVHSRTVHIGLPTRFQHRWRDTQFMLGALEMFTTNSRGLTLKDLRDMSLGAVTGNGRPESPQLRPCAKLLLCRWDRTPRPCTPRPCGKRCHTSCTLHKQPMPEIITTTIVVSVLGLMGNSPHRTVDQIGERTMQEPSPTSFLRTGLDACLTSGAQIPIIRLKIHQCGMSHRTLHTALVGNSG